MVDFPFEPQALYFHKFDIALIGYHSNNPGQSPCKKSGFIFYDFLTGHSSARSAGERLDSQSNTSAKGISLYNIKNPTNNHLSSEICSESVCHQGGSTCGVNIGHQ